MIEFRQVTKRYGEQELLGGVSFRILAGQRIGVVGPNGCGKSTMFGLITGNLQADKGDVQVQSGIRLGYLRQILALGSEQMPLRTYVAAALSELTRMEARIHEIEHRLADPEEKGQAALLEELGMLQTRFEHEGGYTRAARAEEALGGLGFASDRLDHPLRSFSGGWQMRAELAKILISEPDLLLLDEPSNYLDLPAVEWLQRYLKGFRGTLLLISHDRYLLNSLTEQTLELYAGKATLYRGSYDSYILERTERQRQLEAQKKNQDQKRKEIERFVERFRAKNTKATQVQSRIKQLEKMETIDLIEDIRTRGRIRLSTPPPCGVEVIRLEAAGFGYQEGQWLFRDLDLAVQRGDKTAVVGSNGLGKTTLLRILAGQLPLRAGQRTLGHKVQPGFQTQDFAESMSPSATVLQIVREAAPGETEPRLRTLLGGFGFAGKAIEKSVEVLSGGEKIRLAFARLLANPPNFLLLDEPTTHLDIPSREALEQALTEYEGTLVFVSHDVAFVRKVATSILAIAPPGVDRYHGGYDYYLEKLAQANPSATASSRATAAPVSGSAKASRQERAARLQQTAPRKRELEAMLQTYEARMHALEQEQAELVSSLESGAEMSYAQINARLTAIPEELEALSRQWEDAGIELENLQVQRKQAG